MQQLEAYHLLAQDIGRRVTECMQAQNLRVIDVGIALYETLKFTEGSARGYIGAARKGFLELHGTHLSHEDRQRKLVRATYLLHFLGVKPEDPLIARMRSIDPSVPYPPTMPVPSFCP